MVVKLALYDMGVRENLPWGVSHLIYMSAFALPENSSMMGKVEVNPKPPFFSQKLQRASFLSNIKEMGDGALMTLVFIFEDDGTVLCRDPKRTIVGSGPNEDEIARYVGKFIVWNGKCMYDNIEHAAWRYIPVSYIITTEDGTVPFRYQQSIVEYLRAQGREVLTFEIQSGHCPNLTKTAEVVDAIN